MTEEPGAGIAGAVARLYGQAPGAFIKERNALAAQAKSSGDKPLSDQIKQLPKPSIGVWLINQLARQRPAELARVLGVSAALRAAQDDRDGDELRRLSRVRGEVLRDVIAAGRAVGDELGQPISDSIASEVEQALRAALADEDAATALVSGQLVRSLESTGFGGVDLDGVLAAPELSSGDVLGAPIEPSTDRLDTSATSTSGSAETPASGTARANSGPATATSGTATSTSGSARATSSGSAAKAHRSEAETAEARAAAKGADKAAGKTADKAAEKAAEKAEREQQERHRVRQREADQAAEAAAEAARVADQLLDEGRRTADETAHQLEELAAKLSEQREQVRELEVAARQARRESRDADRARRHVGFTD